MLSCSFICLNIFVFLTKPRLSSRPSSLQRNSATIQVNLTSIDAKLPIKKEIFRRIMHTWRFLLVVCPQLWFRGMCITHDIPAGLVWGPYLRMKIYSGAVVINCHYLRTPHHFFVVQMWPNMSDSAISTSVQIQIIMCVCKRKKTSSLKGVRHDYWVYVSFKISWPLRFSIGHLKCVSGCSNLNQAGSFVRFSTVILYIIYFTFLGLPKI